ncbi:MAG TPA: HD-GYP domain-containing protein [Bacillota bacterium]|mgnify:FL=1|nr:HD-GYP domain-containing protein [Bacillota bacterium]
MVIADLQDTLEGAYLALPIHGDGGKLMLATGTRLTKNVIRALRSRGYTKVVIRKSLVPNLKPSNPISHRTRLQTETALDQAANRLLTGQSPDLKQVFEAVDAIIADLWSNSGMSRGIVSIQTYDRNTYTHSINVCVLSIAIGDTLGWPLNKLRELGTAALLHDIGKILIPVDLLNKPGPLTNEEYGLMKTHCEKGWEILCECFNACEYVARGALEHHERLDGSGYPRGLTARDISDIGKITTVADVYDAMTADRPHRKAIFPEAVYTHMNKCKGVLLDTAAVDALFSRVALYPTGTILSLWGGYIAVVTGQDPRSNRRPLVRIIGGPGITKPIDLALYSRPDIKINLLLKDYVPDGNRVIAGGLENVSSSSDS